MSEEKKTPHWKRYLDTPEDEDWNDPGEDRPAKLERRRHRDPEDIDERKALERRPLPRHKDHHGRDRDDDR